MDNTQPLSKRSRRLLEEISRHLVYAARGMDRLSLDEHIRLNATLKRQYLSDDMTATLLSLRWLADAIQYYLAEREQP